MKCDGVGVHVGGCVKRNNSAFKNRICSYRFTTKNSLYIYIQKFSFLRNTLRIFLRLKLFLITNYFRCTQRPNSSISKIHYWDYHKMLILFYTILNWKMCLTLGNFKKSIWVNKNISLDYCFGSLCNV